MGGNINAPNATVTANGVTITIVQTLTDSHSMYVLYEMSVPDWLTLTDDIIWHSDFLLLEPDLSQYPFVTSAGTTILHQSGNNRTALIDLSQSAPIKKDGIAKLTFENLSRVTYDSNGAFKDLVPNSLAAPPIKVMIYIFGLMI